MKRLSLYLFIFCVALCVPLSYVIWRTWTGLYQQEEAELRFFAETLFDAMEKELGERVTREENRPVDAYEPFIASADGGLSPSPLAEKPEEPFILGYLQNNPDGSLETPHASDVDRPPPEAAHRVRELAAANRIFNQKKYTLPAAGAPAGKREDALHTTTRPKGGFAERYLATPSPQSSLKNLGRQKARVEALTPRQAARLARDRDTRPALAPGPGAHGPGAGNVHDREMAALPQEGPLAEALDAGPEPAAGRHGRFEVEVAPLQSVFITSDRVFIFRRVAIGDRIFRQGLILELRPFLSHLAKTHFSPHPMAGFTRLAFTVMGREAAATGAEGKTFHAVAQRTFPAPFHFLGAAVLGDGVPASPHRRNLLAALGALAAVMLAGVAAIYQSVRSVVALSERRSQFVSAVTHELKTPLTNIRMYAEMLKDGVATTRERQEAYLGIIESESARLSRLIHQVLELSRMEKRPARPLLERGDLSDVLSEVRGILLPRIEAEGFELVLPGGPLPVFFYDREAMVQTLINLVENSIKFGAGAPERRIVVGVAARGSRVRISVSDTGPGIPRSALRRVFDDFYRADNTLTRTTGGTGIGLSLVKRRIEAMGGHVTAANNPRSGCTITLDLPSRPPAAASNGAHGDGPSH